MTFDADILRRAGFSVRAVRVRRLSDAPCDPALLQHARLGPVPGRNQPARLTVDARQQLGLAVVQHDTARAGADQAAAGDRDGGGPGLARQALVAAGAAAGRRGVLPAWERGGSLPRCRRSAGPPAPLAGVRPPIHTGRAGAAAAAWASSATAIGVHTFCHGPGSAAAAWMLSNQLAGSTRENNATWWAALVD